MKKHQGISVKWDVTAFFKSYKQAGRGILGHIDGGTSFKGFKHTLTSCLSVKIKCPLGSSLFKFRVHLV